MLVLRHSYIPLHCHSKYLQVAVNFRWTQSQQVGLQTSATYILNPSQFPQRFIAVNSDPKVEVLTEFCRLEYAMIGALLTNINIPVWDRRVALSGV